MTPNGGGVRLHDQRTYAYTATNTEAYADPEGTAHTVPAADASLIGT